MGERQKTAIEKGRAIHQSVTGILVNGTFLAPLALIFQLGTSVYLSILLVVQGLSSLVWLVLMLFNGHTLLMRGRRSRFAVVEPASDGATIDSNVSQ